MKQRGSAILIAVFLVAAVGSAAFAIGRLFLMDAAISDKYESSVVAYYAAESGIEEGLLRYRYNKNQEVPIGTSMPIVEFGDSSATTATINDPDAYQFQPLKRYYVPSVEYLTEFYGENVQNPTTSSLEVDDIADANYPDIYRIPKDEAIKLDLSHIDVANNEDIKLYFMFIDSVMGDDKILIPSICNPHCPFIEVALTGITPTSSGNLYQSKIAIVKNVTPAVDVNNIKASDRIDVFSSSSFLTDKYVMDVSELIEKIRNKNVDPIFDTTNSNLSIMIKPLYADAIIGIKATGTVSGAKVLPAPYNTVKSTGFYGGVTRTLEAKIDRQAGTVYDLFDYVVYDYN